MTARARAAALAAAALSAGLAPPAAAQSPSPSQPSQAHERLVFFEGTWTTLESRPEDDFRETCAWLPEGRRHMVCRSRWTVGGEAREGWSIFSYDEATRAYLYHGFRSGGGVVVQRGQPEGSGWRFASGQRRATLTPSGEGAFRLVHEVAAGEGAWKPAGEVNYRRLR